MTTQVGSGSTDATGAFSITLTTATAPDPIYIKASGGTDIDTGMPAPTMRFVGNSSGTNALTTFNITPLTDDVMDRVDRGETLAAAQAGAISAFGLASNTGTNGLYEDPTLTANAALRAAAFSKLTAGTTGGTIGAGSYKMFAIVMGKADITIPRTIATIAGLTASTAFVTADITVAANGDITGTGGAGVTFTGKVVGSSMVFNIIVTPTHITRVAGNIGLYGSVAGNFTDIDGIGGAPIFNNGVFVGSLIPASGVSTAGLSSFLTSFYTPDPLGTTTTGTGLMNLVARDIFIPAATIPRIYWGQTGVKAINVSGGSVTMSDMAARPDAGSVAGAAGTFLFTAGSYINVGTVPTNLLVFSYNIGGGSTLYVATSVGLRRGIYFVTDPLNKVVTVGDSYMSKARGLSPSGFTAGATHDITTANTHPGMPGLSRTAALAQGLTPSAAGAMSIPATLTLGNAYLDSTTVPAAPELMVFQGSMFAMKKDALDTFATNQISGGADTHIRLVQFLESGAFQGEAIQGGTIPGGLLLMRNFPDNMVGFIHDQASTTTPAFSGTLNFLARTQYASSYTGFANAYVSGTLAITAPGAGDGSATLIATSAGSTTATTATLTVVKPLASQPGLYHMHGAFGATEYIDIVWPVGGTKAVWAISDNASGTGTVTDVGEAFMTL